MVAPKVNSAGQRELDKAESQLASFEDQVKMATCDMAPFSPKEEIDPQTKLSSREANKADAPYIKPTRSINSREKFDEKFKDAHTRAWEYVKCIVENYEIIGESVECWTKKFPGDSAHFWKVPVNKPVYIPRLLAEQLSQCRYHRLSMQADSRQITGADGMGTYVGNMVVDTVKNRIDARPVGFGFTSMSM